MPINTDTGSGFDEIILSSEVSGLQKLCHEIRGRLANLLGAARGGKVKLRDGTLERLTGEINSRCEELVRRKNSYAVDKKFQASVMKDFIEKETMKGKRDRPESINLEGKDIDFIISLLAVAGVPRDNSVLYFSSVLGRRIRSNSK